MDIAQAWIRTLLEWQAMKHYHEPYRLILPLRTFRNPLIEHFLPSVMLVKVVAVFDEAIMESIDSAHGGLTKGYKADLNGRIRFLVDRGLVPNGPQLHETRNLRNRVAHEEDGHASWEELENAIGEVENALLAFKLVSLRPKLEFYWDRSGVELSKEKGVLGTRTMQFGVRADGEVAYKAEWTETLHRLDPNASGVD